uniref:ATPase family AAA domain containing 5a n=1 Tax=Hippocampus comes TaxID=109280 RepID=A0A3Q2XJ85_HIPCM
MAGVVAMASVIEDFDTQPCNKSSTDGGSAVVKTITSYFSPVAKAVEKPFSPPRSNNIMDYFNRGPLTSKVKSSPSQTIKEIGQRSSEKHINLEVADKQQSVKRKRKTTKAVSKVVDHGTDALLAQISADAYISNRSMESNTCQPVKQAQNDECHKNASKCGKGDQPERDVSTNCASSTVARVKDKGKPVKTKAVCTSRTTKQKEENYSESEQEGAENSCAVHMEITGGSELKSNTVRISFEDFVRSQSEVKGEEKTTAVQCEGNKIPREADELDTYQLDTSNSIASTEVSVQVSPRTITIQAQMHTISPKQEAGKPVASRNLLMNWRKGARSLAKTESPSHMEPVTAKRKSNVVLEEEDLDLAVIESESTPKCHDIERRQFMAAFKQPSLDGSKAKLGKNQAKQKQPAEKDAEENDFQENKTMTNTKPQRKCMKTAERVTTSSKIPEDTLPTESDDKEEPDASLNPSRPVVRRSRREAVVRPAPQTSETSAVSKVDSLKDCAETSVKGSSPKIRKSKYGVYVAEMLCPPDAKESPIRCTPMPLFVCFKTSDNSKKQKKAKKLVAKAKAVQQTKKDVVEKNTLRRSSRTEASISKSYCEDEYTVFSHEGSENCQDDEQFKARRDFLKSGLPESFKKQSAKAAATKETYTLSCASFQPVVHMMQIPNDCPLWSLPWPESPQLCRLNELCIQMSDPYLPLSGSLGLKTKLQHRVFRERGSGWRLEISEKVRQLLMEEVSTSNPVFPGKTFLPRFLARRADHQQHFGKSETASTRSSPESVGAKRKRTDDKVAKVAKKQRAAHHEDNICTLEPKPSESVGRTRRAQRARLDKAKDKPSPGKKDAVIKGHVLLFSTVEVKEDVLWTEKYQPQHSGDIIGNTASVQMLHSWLKEWKLRADRDERNKQKEKKQEEGSNDSDWDCRDEDSLSAEDSLCNTVLIIGPTGIGKTASVYACAQELGFKVFEVNASSQRSGRLILSQLKEATQSHQVDSQGVSANKPAYFNSYSTSSGTGKYGCSPRKLNSPRGVVSSPRKPPTSPRGTKRGGLAPTSLANFFKMARPSNKDPLSTKREDQKGKCFNYTTVKSPVASTTEENEEQSKRTPTSLILFEEVDVIFEEDAGFLAAIKTFMSTTKRPVILTTTDPTFSTTFDGNFEEIHFKTPSLLDVSSYLRLLCLVEDTRTDQRDVSALLQLNGCDLRRSLLQLQCWTRSAGGRHMTSHSDDKPGDETADTCALSVTSPRPPCESGCTESRLGLLNIEPERDVWDTFLHQQSQTHEMACWELLMESTRQGVNLLYSNMETLLPLPRTQLISTYKPEPPSDIASACSQSDALPLHERLPHSPGLAESSDDGSPIKVSRRMKRSKRRHNVPNQDGLHSESDSEESFLSLCKQQEGPQSKEEPSERLVPHLEKRKPLTQAERQKSVPVSLCLESISDFFHNMSDLDSSLVHHGRDAHRGPSQVSAALKDGMTDDSRVELDTLSWVVGERTLEIQTAVEALSFHKCRRSVEEAWDRARRLEGQLADDTAAELTLPVAAHCECYRFTQSSLCQPQRDLMENLVCTGTFATLGNRSAVAVDYLPALRTICRSEQIKEQGKVKRRFLHYLDSIRLGLHKNSLQYLSKDFP